MALLDEDIPELPPHERFSDAELRNLQARIGQSNSRHPLYVIAEVELTLPCKCAPADGIPSIKHMALGWPAITSVHSLRLVVRDGDRLRDHAVMFNPIKRCVEWTDIPLQPIAMRSGTDLQVYRSALMRLQIEQPGELYQQDVLNGQVEVEIPGSLLSGLKVQVYNGAGRMQRRAQPTLATHVTSNVCFVPDDVFARRPLALYQHLHFDEVIPEDRRVADIRAALTDRGFQIAQDQRFQHDDALHHFFLGERSEGPDMLRLWLFVEGKRYPAERKAQMQGGMTFTSTFESGEIEIYMCGELAGNSQRLTHQMNSVQAALRERFAHLRAKR